MPTPTEIWFWMMTDEFGRRRKSPCRFTVAEAMKRDPTAERVPGSCEIRDCPDGPDDVRLFSTSDVGMRIPGKDR